MSTDIESLKKRIAELSGPMSPVPTGTKPELRSVSDIRFLMFDFYGTLFLSSAGDIGIDEEPGTIGEFREALNYCGIDAGNQQAEQGLRYFEETVENHKNRLISRGIDHPEPAIEVVWSEVLDHIGTEKNKPGIDMDLARRFAVEFEVRMNPVWPTPGLHKILSELNERTVTLGIISNSQFYTPIVFEALMNRSLTDFGFHPDLLHWSFAEQIKKPSLKFYQRFLDKLRKLFPNSQPREVLYVGNDMLKDIYPAATLGMKTALFAGDKRSLKWRRDDKRCDNIWPDLIITKLDQLADCLDG